MTTLAYKACAQAPGDRDLWLTLVDPQTGQDYELHLRPEDVQRVIYACADVAKQIGAAPPIDWDLYRAQIFWPAITPWTIGPAAATAESR